MNEEALNQVEEENQENQEIEEAEIVEVETEVSEEESQDDSTEEKTEDEHAQYSEKVQKRINTLTRKLREAERGQESAYEYAKKLRDENKGLKQKTTSLDQSYLSEAENRLKSQKTQAMSILSQAHAEQDFDKVAKAQDILAKIAVEESKISTNRQQLETQQQVQEDDGFDQVFSQQAQPQYTPPPPSQKAEAWAQKNSWFADDEEMTEETLKIHQDIILGNKAEPESDEYYSLLDQGVRDAFPEKFYDGGNVQSKPSQKVASATRADAKVSGKRNVKLSPSEVQMAKRLNVPLTEYAKYVKR
jgi:hypothetical protein